MNPLGYENNQRVFSILLLVCIFLVFLFHIYIIFGMTIFNIGTKTMRTLVWVYKRKNTDLLLYSSTESRCVCINVCWLLFILLRRWIGYFTTNTILIHTVHASGIRFVQKVCFHFAHFFFLYVVVSSICPTDRKIAFIRICAWLLIKKDQFSMPNLRLISMI